MKRVELEMLSLLKTKNKENFLSLSKSLSHSSYECQTVEGGGGGNGGERCMEWCIYREKSVEE